MRLHYRSCRKYIEEFGSISEPTVPFPVQTPNVAENSVFIPNITVSITSTRCVSTLKYIMPLVLLHANIALEEC